MLNNKEKKRLLKIEKKYLPSLEHINIISFENFNNILALVKKESKFKIDIFPVLIEYIFLKMKGDNKINQNIFIAANPNKNNLTKDVTVIYVNNFAERPSINLAIYSILNDKLNKCFLLLAKQKFKTSIEQIYQWKLLLEIATSDCSIKDKYSIRYENNTMPLVGFATVNFYNEINNPQHRGMFQFFDRAFIGKPLNEDFIENLSQLPCFVNENL